MPITMATDPRAALACLAAYLFGSVPFVHALGRRRHVDLRRVGSGNVGAANLWATAGILPAGTGWLLDASKGALPVALIRPTLGPDTAALAGACGVAGQCWPLFLGFNGGRGTAPALGALAVLDRRACSIAALSMLGGAFWRLAPLLRRRARPSPPLRSSRSRAVPLACLLGLLASPAAARGASGGASVRGAAIVAAIIVARRLTAPLPDDPLHGPRAARAALVYRLLYDRNTAR